MYLHCQHFFFFFFNENATIVLISELFFQIFSALITGPLTDIFQPRWIVMACGVLTCLGMSCCALASNWATFAFCLVILAGKVHGYSVSESSSQSAVAYFKNFYVCFHLFFFIAKPLQGIWLLTVFAAKGGNLVIQVRHGFSLKKKGWCNIGPRN